MSVNQRLGYTFGAIYVLVGLVGFAATADIGFAQSDGALLLGLFEVNPLHNVVHLAVGAGLAAAAASGATVSRAVNLAVGSVYLLVGVAGVALVGGSSLNLLALNHADNALHFASSAVLLGVGIYESVRTLAHA